MRIFHIATVSDWDAALADGRYTTSTRGRTLAEEGFIHASRGDQWQGVRDRFYADVTEPLLLLVIETDRLDSPVLDEPVPDSTETFPHVYGAIGVDAVVQTIALTADGATRRARRRAPSGPPEPTPPAPPAPPTDRATSFSRLYLEEMFRNVLLASAVLASVVAATLVGLAIDDQWGPLIGALVGLVIGVGVVRRVFRRAGPA